jgi:hypothetical protein
VRWLRTDGVAENRGKHGGDGLSEADMRPIARTTSKTEGSFYSRASRGSTVGLHMERGREVTLDAAAERACARTVQRCNGNGRHERHMKGGGDFVHTLAWDGELDKGSASRCPHCATRGASAPCLPGYVRARASLHMGLDGVLSVASAQPVGQAA